MLIAQVNKLTYNMKRNERKLLFEIYSKVTLEEFDEDSGDKLNLAEIINSINNYLYLNYSNIYQKLYRNCSGSILQITLILKVIFNNVIYKFISTYSYITLKINSYYI